MLAVSRVDFAHPSRDLSSVGPACTRALPARAIIYSAFAALQSAVTPGLISSLFYGNAL